MSKKILLITGESSGDFHGSLVFREIKTIDPSVSIYGIGGDELEKAGMQLLYHAKDLSVVGVIEVLFKAGHIIKAMRIVRKAIRDNPPDMVVLIDYPDFNLRVASYAKKRGIPVFYYISPQVWAWRRGRAKKMAAMIDTIAVIFPFEAEFFRRAGMDVHFVGHPLLDVERDIKPREELLGLYQIDAKAPVIGLLPGSRKSEVDRLLVPMLDAAAIIKTEKPSAQFVIPLASGIDAGYVEKCIREQDLPITVVPDSFYNMLSMCDMAVVASGTATLETALMQKPMIIVYKVSLLTYVIGRLLIKVPFIGLVNILAGKKIAQELLQSEVNGKRIASEVLNMLNNPDIMDATKKELSLTKSYLGEKGASRRVAELVLRNIYR